VTLFPPLLVPAALLFCGLAAAAPSGPSARLPEHSPEGIIGEVQRAVDAKDAARFEQLVDVRGVADRAVGALLEEAAKSPEGTTILPPLPALMLSSLKDSPRALSELRALLARETENFVRYGVRSGYFAGRADANVRPEGLQALLFSDVSPGRKQLSPAGPALPAGPAGPAGKDAALLPAELRDHGTGNGYPLLLRLQRTESGWRVAELVNMLALWERIQAEMR
jgi:hypothetical protein